MSDELLWTPERLGEYLGVPEATLAQWRYLGSGPAFFKVGRFVRYSETDIKEWLDRQRVGGIGAMADARQVRAAQVRKIEDDRK